MIKRMADFLEKFAVASFAVGLFQNKFLAIILGLITFTASMILTQNMEKGD